MKIKLFRVEIKLVVMNSSFVLLELRISNNQILVIENRHCSTLCFRVRYSKNKLFKRQAVQKHNFQEFQRKVEIPSNKNNANMSSTLKNVNFR